MKRWPMKKRNKKKNKIFKALCLIFILTVLYTLIILLDQYMTPAVIAASSMEIKTRANTAIDNSVKKCLAAGSVSYEDFFIKTSDSSGKVTSITANTILINDICSQIAVDVSEELTNLSNKKIKIPLGALSGVAAFANIGPAISFTVMPKGTAEVDYATTFDSVGINQVHFEVYLTVKTTLQIINPLQRSELIITRKLTVIDTVLSGDVPSAYLGLP